MPKLIDHRSVPAITRVAGLPYHLQRIERGMNLLIEQLRAEESMLHKELMAARVQGVANQDLECRFEQTSLKLKRIWADYLELMKFCIGRYWIHARCVGCGAFIKDDCAYCNGSLPELEVIEAGFFGLEALRKHKEMNP